MADSPRVAIVTGAARPWGLGRRIAVGLAERGFDIAVVDVREDWGQEAAGAIASETGRRAIFSKTDVTERADVEAMVRNVVSELGGVDVLVNNVGIVHHEPVEELSDETLNRVMGINFTGTALCCQAVIGPMRDRGGGRIVNISSGGAVRPIPGLAVYAASKASVIAFSKVLAREVARDGIVVTTIAPGEMPTAMGSEEGPSEGERPPGPLGRQLETDDVADVAIFAATSAHNALTGQTLHANAGVVLV